MHSNTCIKTILLPHVLYPQPWYQVSRRQQELGICARQPTWIYS